MEMTARAVQRGGTCQREPCQLFFLPWHRQSCRSAPGDPAQLFSCPLSQSISHSHDLRMWISDFFFFPSHLHSPFFHIASHSVCLLFIYLSLFSGLALASFYLFPAFPFLLPIWFLCCSYSSTLIPFLLSLDLYHLTPPALPLTRPAFRASSVHCGFQPRTSPSLLTCRVARPRAVLQVQSPPSKQFPKPLGINLRFAFPNCWRCLLDFNKPVSAFLEDNCPDSQ